MKKLIVILLAIVVLASCANSPDYQPALTVSETTLNFGRTADSKTVVVNTKESWTVECGSLGGQWFTVSPMSGKGKTTLTVTVSTLEGNLEYSSFFNVTTPSGAYVQVEVNQK